MPAPSDLLEAASSVVNYARLHERCTLAASLSGAVTKLERALATQADSSTAAPPPEPAAERYKTYQLAEGELSAAPPEPAVQPEPAGWMRKAAHGPVYGPTAESVRSPREEESFREPVPLYARAAAPPEDRWHYDAEPPVSEWVEGWITDDRYKRGWWTPVFRSPTCGLQWRFDRLDFEPNWKLTAWRRVSPPLPPPPAGLEGE